jgi:hypothetical protein
MPQTGRCACRPPGAATAPQPSNQTSAPKRSCRRPAPRGPLERGQLQRREPRLVRSGQPARRRISRPTRTSPGGTSPPTCSRSAWCSISSSATVTARTRIRCPWSTSRSSTQGQPVLVSTPTWLNFSSRHAPQPGAGAGQRRRRGLQRRQRPVSLSVTGIQGQEEARGAPPAAVRVSDRNRDGGIGTPLQQGDNQVGTIPDG